MTAAARPQPPREYTSALHAHERRFEAAAVEPLFQAIGVVLLVERTGAYAVDRAARLLALGNPGLHAHQRQLGTLGLGVVGGAERAGLHKVHERIGARRRCRAVVAAAGRG